MGSYYDTTKQNAAQFSQQHAPPTVTPQPPQVQQQPILAKSNEEGLAEHAERLRKFQRLGNSMIQMGPPRLDNNTTSSVQPKPWIQRKLTIGEPRDKYEQEADRVASHVVQTINAPTSKENSIREWIQREKDLEGVMQSRGFQAALHRQQAITGGEASPNLESAINSARGSGQPLDAGLQQSMGQAMGADFSGVRMHRDAHSDQLNQSIQARAFTTGQDVFFRAGAYQPGNRGGQELIAHELTHVVQQIQGKGVDINNGKGWEQETDVIGQLLPQKKSDSLQKRFTLANSAQNILQNTSTNRFVIQRVIEHISSDTENQRCEGKFYNAFEAFNLICPYLDNQVDAEKVKAALREMDRKDWKVYSVKNLVHDALRLANFLVKLTSQSDTYYFDIDAKELLGDSVPTESLVSEFGDVIKFQSKKEYLNFIDVADVELRKDLIELRKLQGFDQVLLDATSMSFLHIERAEPGRGAHFSPGENNINTVRVSPPDEISKEQNRNALMFEIINAAHKPYFDLALARKKASEGRESSERTNAIYAIDCERVSFATAIRQLIIHRAAEILSDWLAYFWSGKMKFSLWLTSQVNEEHTQIYDETATSSDWIGHEIVKESWADGMRDISVDELGIQEILSTVGQGPIDANT